jgi:hypothetical protein
MTRNEHSRSSGYEASTDRRWWVVLRATEVVTGESFEHEFAVVSPTAKGAEAFVASFWPGGDDWTIEIHATEATDPWPRRVN